MATILDRDALISELDRAKRTTDSPIEFMSDSLTIVANHLARNTKAAVAELEERIRTLEGQKSAMGYRGVWSADDQYGPGDFVTDDGSMWHCNTPTCERPGHSPAWTLAVKRGKDARSAR